MVGIGILKSRLLLRESLPEGTLESELLIRTLLSFARVRKVWSCLGGVFSRDGDGEEDSLADAMRAASPGVMAFL